VNHAPLAKSRFGLLLAAEQIRYQLLLLLRSPMSTFTAVVIPFIVLMALDIATPQAATRHLHHTSYADFLIPAMATFALLNACYVSTITSVVIAREEGVLKRLHGTPLPLWAYVVGRIAASAVVGAAAVFVVLIIGAVVMNTRIGGSRLADLIAITALGIVAFTVTGLAVSTLVPRPETALPVAYGTMLPLAFVSDVFFPATAAPTWLRRVAAAFPVEPIADPAERLFARGAGWPMTAGEVLVVCLWIIAAGIVTAARFRWEPGVTFLARRARWHGRRPRRPGVQA
jgi:ABC-2 type transport system permease protein